MVTYNHEKFIAQAIESVLMQKTDFSFELVIGEDCSTDRTREIVLAFQKRHSGIIRASTPKANLGAGRNFVATLKACQGEYIAYLEGDDYWTNPSKLAKQVAMLEAHPETTVCFHRVGRQNDFTGDTGPDQPPLEFHRPFITHEEIIRGFYMQTCSVLFRRKALPNLDNGFVDLKAGDVPLFMLLTRKGPAVFLDETMATYRIHSTGCWSSMRVGDKLRTNVKGMEYVLPHVQPESRKWVKAELGRRYLFLARHTFEFGGRSEALGYAWRSLSCCAVSRDRHAWRSALLVLELTFPRLVGGLRALKQKLHGPKKS